MFEEIDDELEFRQFCRSLDDLKEEPKLFKPNEGFAERIMAALPRKSACSKKPTLSWLRSGLSIAAAIGIGVVYWKSQSSPAPTHLQTKRD